MPRWWKMFSDSEILKKSCLLPENYAEKRLFSTTAIRIRMTAVFICKHQEWKNQSYNPAQEWVQSNFLISEFFEAAYANFTIDSIKSHMNNWLLRTLSRFNPIPDLISCPDFLSYFCDISACRMISLAKFIARYCLPFLASKILFPPVTPIPSLSDFLTELVWFSPAEFLYTLVSSKEDSLTGFVSIKWFWSLFSLDFPVKIKPWMGLLGLELLRAKTDFLLVEGHMIPSLFPWTSVLGRIFVGTSLRVSTDSVIGQVTSTRREFFILSVLWLGLTFRENEVRFENKGTTLVALHDVFVDVPEFVPEKKKEDTSAIRS